MTIELYSDGACSGNGSPNAIGGWAVILKCGDHQKTLTGRERNTTNSRMELTAVIQGLSAIMDDDSPIKVYSDSEYLVKCINDRWYQRWLDQNWRLSTGQPVKNLKLWVELLTLYFWYQDTIEFIHIRGHAGHKYNELADQLAKQAILKGN
jgi:ribonuclease HI